MRQFWKITIYIGIVLVFAGLIQAQTLKTATGHFCGFSEGDGGYLTMRVGKAERTFAWFGDEPELKFVGFKKGAIPTCMRSPSEPN